IYDENGFLAERTVAGTPPPPPTRTLDTFLRAGPRVLGVLRVAQRSMREELSAAEQKRLETIAAQLVLVLERAQLAEEAARMRAQAEAERVKGALLSSVSHDLRTPLAVIKGAVTNLLDESVAWDVATRHELLNAVDTETDRLNRLVGNLLEMSRIESGALHPARDWHDIAELLADVAERMRARFTEHSVTLSAPPDLPLVQISYTQIDQVLTNLLENAQKYTPPGTPIELRAELADDAIRITVRDYGPGIPAGMHSRIFEKFVRAAAPERHADGTGLGLAICKGIIEAHGGQIWAEAAPGGGAAFVFTLPLPPDEQPTSALDLAEAEVASSV
ncbi:MAG: sensor histidine kinase KdpD, partial [Chloroflexi bacterium SZAS-1]|nr:sensor histidine kinase KdpD [Chloroflexi bacterium SZAS-1]